MAWRGCYFESAARSGGRAMKKIVYFVVSAAVLLTGLAAVIYFGDQPRSESQIALSFFDSPEAVATAIEQRLEPQFREADILLLGVWPGFENEIDLARALLRAFADSPSRYDIVLIEGGLPGAGKVPEATTINFRDDMPGVVEGLLKAKREGKRVAIIVPSLFASRLLTGGPADHLKNEFHVGSMNLSMAPFPHRREDEKAFPIQCSTDADAEGGHGPLSCAIIHRARMMYRKSKRADKYVLSLDLVGDRDYLMLVTPPGGSAATPDTGP